MSSLCRSMKTFVLLSYQLNPLTVAKQVIATSYPVTSHSYVYLSCTMYSRYSLTRKFLAHSSKFYR